MVAKDSSTVIAFMLSIINGTIQSAKMGNIDVRLFLAMFGIELKGNCSEVLIFNKSDWPSDLQSTDCYVLLLDFSLNPPSSRIEKMLDFSLQSEFSENASMLFGVYITELPKSCYKVIIILN